jgi:lipopolysaccharide transport system permease protein
MSRTQIRVIRPSHGWSFTDLNEIWEYRDLLYFFIWRDIKVRHKQITLGALWAVVQPFFTMVVFTVIFGNLAKIPSEGVPYPVFVYCTQPITSFSYPFRGSQDVDKSVIQLVKDIGFEVACANVPGIVTRRTDPF